MLTTLKNELAEIIRQRSNVLVVLTHNDINPLIIIDEIDELRKLKEAYDKLDEAS